MDQQLNEFYAQYNSSFNYKSLIKFELSQEKKYPWYPKISLPPEAAIYNINETLQKGVLSSRVNIQSITFPAATLIGIMSSDPDAKKSSSIIKFINCILSSCKWALISEMKHLCMDYPLCLLLQELMSSNPVYLNYFIGALNRVYVKYEYNALYLYIPWFINQESSVTNFTSYHDYLDWMQDMFAFVDKACEQTEIKPHMIEFVNDAYCIDNMNLLHLTEIDEWEVPQVTIEDILKLNPLSIFPGYGGAIHGNTIMVGKLTPVFMQAYIFCKYKFDDERKHLYPTDETMGNVRLQRVASNALTMITYLCFDRPRVNYCITIMLFLTLMLPYFTDVEFYRLLNLIGEISPVLSLGENSNIDTLFNAIHAWFNDNGSDVVLYCKK